MSLTSSTSRTGQGLISSFLLAATVGDARTVLSLHPHLLDWFVTTQLFIAPSWVRTARPQVMWAQLLCSRLAAGTIIVGNMTNIPRTLTLRSMAIRLSPGPTIRLDVTVQADAGFPMATWEHSSEWSGCSREYLHSRISLRQILVSMYQVCLICTPVSCRRSCLNL